MTDAISEGATERLEEYCREAEKRRDGKIGGASDLLHEMSGPHQRLYVSDLRALLAAKEAAEAERDALRAKLEAVVREYPIAAGTAKMIDPEERGYGSIRAAADHLTTIDQPKEGEDNER